MEYQPETCHKPHKKDSVNILNKRFHASSESSLSSNSDTLPCLFKLLSRKNDRKFTQKENHPRDYLTRIFDKKRLKDKSLSKKMKTPFDRKLNRTCWPIQLNKISKIKKKPREKRKCKPTNRSLKKRKFSNPTFDATTGDIKKSSSIFETDSLDDESFEELNRNLNNKNHFFYEPVTPQMLMDVLQDPEHLKSGATLDMIISKLRALKLELNPSKELLKEEVLQKLECAIKLGLVKKNNEYYIVADSVQMRKLPRKKVDAFWDLWHRTLADCEEV